MPHRITIRDIAERAGVHFTTVSLALRNNPKLPLATRTRIQQLALELGYKPDAMLSALSAYRATLHVPKFRATAAFINNWPRREELFQVPVFREYFEGARDRAEALGYKLEEIWACAPGMTPKRLSGMLQARGIKGLIFAPQPGPGMKFTLDWENFSAVALGYSLVEPALHVVSNHQFRSFGTLMHELRLLGYRRIGYIHNVKADARVGTGWQASFWVDYHAQPLENRVEPLTPATSIVDVDTVERWIKAQKVEVIVSFMWNLCQELPNRGLRVPEDIGLAFPTISNHEEIVAGVYENSVAIGASAFDILVSLLQRQDQGVPKVRQFTLVDSTWNANRTVRQVGPAVVNQLVATNV
jgi:DNA-binding LacI/PurR family transcriptional regulator